MGSTRSAAQMVAEMRLKKGITQRELADLLHMDKSAVGRIESGSLPVGKETCEKLIELFELHNKEAEALMAQIFVEEMERIAVSLVNNIIRATDKLASKYKNDIARTLPEQVVNKLQKSI